MAYHCPAASNYLVAAKLRTPAEVYVLMKHEKCFIETTEKPKQARRTYHRGAVRVERTFCPARDHRVAEQIDGSTIGEGFFTVIR